MVVFKPLEAGLPEGVSWAVARNGVQASRRWKIRFGGGRRRLSHIVLAASVALVGLALASAPASAALEYELASSFGVFVAPEAIAVDQATHDVYVVDPRSQPQVVKRFNAAGEPVDFSATQPYVAQNELTGTAEGGFNFDSSGAAAELAVDNSGGPANGDLYVTDSNDARVDVFAPDGSFLGTVDPTIATPQSGGEPCGIAVDPSGNVYVGYFSGHVDRYTPVDGSPGHDLFSGQLENVGEICQVAVNAVGDVYVDTWPSGPLREYEPSQFGLETPAGTEIDPSAYAVAVDPASQHVFVDEQTRIAEYEASGILVATPFGALGDSRGVGVDGASGNVYASDRASGKVDLFVLPVAGPPGVKNEFAANVSGESAELRAEVKPNLRDTRYFFRYGPDTSYGSGEVPASPGADVGAGSHAVEVRAQLRNLSPGTTYHYQLVANNELGTTHGPDRTFTTFSPAGLPALPDNRAWEMVSPLAKNGADIAGILATEEDLGSGAPEQASLSGNSVAYVAIGSFADGRGQPRGSQYFSTRGPEGWTTRNITPPLLAGSYSVLGHGTPYKGFSLDMSSALLANGDIPPFENPQLAPNMPFGYQNFYLRNLADEGFQALLTNTPEEAPSSFVMELEGTTPDLSHVVFASDAALTNGAVDAGGVQRNLYEWSAGQLQAVNTLPNGEPAPGAALGSGFIEGHTLSDDGRRVFWSHEGALYVHESGVPTTQIDASRIGGEGGRGVFRTASSDGSRVFFTDALRLTADSTAHTAVGGEDLYLFDTNSHQLSDITVDTNPADSQGAAVQGILGASADGSYIYYVAKGNLAQGAAAGEDNLYVWHEGQTRFIATLVRQDEEAFEAPRQGLANDWSDSLGRRTSRVTSSGTFAVFMSAARLTGYDNTNVTTGKPDEEVYLYDAASGGLSCVSCDPSNERPIGPASIPSGTHFEDGPGKKSLYQPRVISEDGSRVFFETQDGLVPHDTNGQLDVYEYEAGHVLLISGGTSPDESSFVDASANGSDVFFVTRQQLVAQDTDTLVDLYDARENGGFPAPPSAPAPCDGESCKPLVSSQPNFGAPSSVMSGPSENLRPPAAIKHKSKARHKPKKHRRKRRKSKAKRRRAARAGTGRGR